MDASQKLTNFIKKNVSHSKCQCPVVRSASGYFKKHECIDGKKRAALSRPAKQYEPDNIKHYV